MRAWRGDWPALRRRALLSRKPRHPAGTRAQRFDLRLRRRSDREDQDRVAQARAGRGRAKSAEYSVGGLESDVFQKSDLRVNGLPVAHWPKYFVVGATSVR